MASSKLAARAIRNHAKYKGRNDLNIVPMIDMMVILAVLPAVHGGVLQYEHPRAESSGAQLLGAGIAKGLQLEVIVRQNVIEIADRNSGVLRTLPRKDGEYDYKGLSEYLQFVKSKYQSVMAASVLMEQDIPYDVLVQTMDNVRLFQKDDPPLFTEGRAVPGHFRG